MSELISEIEVIVPGEPPKEANQGDRLATARRAAKENGHTSCDSKQAWENSELKTSSVAEVMNDLEGKLFNLRDANLAILHEKPEHRIILLLKLRGLSNREIARQTGYTEPWISQVCRQPWFQLQLTQALKETEGEIVDKIVAVEAVNSIYKLVQLRDTAKSEEVQKSSAVEIINRHLGKPVNRTEIRGTFEHSLVKVDKINEELAVIEEEERRLLHLGTHG